MSIREKVLELKAKGFDDFKQELLRLDLTDNNLIMKLCDVRDDIDDAIQAAIDTDEAEGIET